MSDTHEQLIDAFNTYIAENDKLTERNIKASAVRARQALQDIARLLKERRKEISAEKVAIGPKIIGKPRNAG